MTYKIKAGRYLHFCPSYNVSVNAAYTECVSDMFHICRDYSNVCSKPSTHKTKLKENKMDTLNQGKEDKNKDIIENNNKNNSGNRNTKSAQFKVAFITQAAVIAALYVVLVIMFNYCSFRPIQFRIAEALTILPYFTPAAIPGLFVGCLLSNILGGAAIWDIIFGSIATLIGAIGTYALRKNKWLAPLPPIIANTLIVPFVLRYAYGSEGVFAMFFVTIGASEFIVCGVIGMLLLFALNPVRNVIFKGVE